MVLMGLYLISFGVVTHLDFAYLLPGHSFMSCDQGFSTLENEFRKHERICSPQCYASKMEKTKNSSHVYLTQDKIYDFKNMAKVIVHRTSTNPQILFSKAHTIELRATHPWSMVLIDTAGREEVNLAIKKTETRSFREMYTAICKIRDGKIKHKYFLNKDLKLSSTKVVHLRSLIAYVDAPGRVWAERVLRGQGTAVARPKQQAITPEIVVPTDHIDQYESPIRFHETETLNRDDSGNEVDDDERPPEPSPEPSSPLADTPPSPEEEEALSLAFIEQLFFQDIAEYEENEPLPALEAQPSSREPPNEPSTSRGEQGHNFVHLQLLDERKDSDSDSD